ncbi:hypothetical protein Micbo1qcDRAFT_234774 [Microdochium bolleyi]|uniref:MYND-type domain-containing protein n=1 Tax=Microdochium bolleyi TaxID=196109 RepID=A0A136IZC0_9PEZI|nr:hypothetical protein Micbo1qcDRAFT_234774 [Microdochium bolleyi]
MSSSRREQVSLFASTPATSLTRSLPHGASANVLVLQSTGGTIHTTNTTTSNHDLRNILYTAHAEHGLPQRDSLYVTTCSGDAAITARDVLLLALILDGGKGGLGTGETWDEVLWELFHDLFISEGARQAVSARADELLELTETGGLEAWESSRYGGMLKFHGEDDLGKVRAVWKQYKDLSTDDTTEVLAASLKQSRDFRDAEAGENLDKEIPLSGLRSAAPVPLASTEIVTQAYRRFWDSGSISSRSDGRTANPLIAAALSPSPTESRSASKILSYASNPILGYHLGATFARLAPGSPLYLSGQDKSRNEFERILEAVKLQFRTWAAALRGLATAGGIKLKFCVEEPLSFFETTESATEASSPATRFDIIDTTSLADEHGFLNVLVAARPLLRPSPVSVVYTEALRRSPGGQTYKQNLDRLMCGDAVLNALLLGLSPVEYWTNTSVESCIDDVLIRGSHDQEPSPYGLSQNHFRASWRLTHHFFGSEVNDPGNAAQQLVMDPIDMARAMGHVLDGMVKLILSSKMASEDESDVEVVLADSALARLRQFVLACLSNVKTVWSDAISHFINHLPSSNISATLQSLSAPLQAGLEDLSRQIQGGLGRKEVQSLGQQSVEMSLEIEPEGALAVVARVKLEDTKAGKVLVSGSPLKLHQTDPFTCTIRIGDEDDAESGTKDVTFPVPVLTDEIKTHINQKRSMVELTAQIVDPVDLGDFSELILPARLTSKYTGRTPVILNNHSVNLDSLPIISVDNESEADRKANSWLATLTSQQFSARERRERELAHEDDTQPASARLNLKESIFTIFMLASGLQGGSTGLFTLSHPTEGNQILIFVRSLRLDTSVGSVVADAAVLPVTRALLDSGELGEFLLVLRELEACVIDVSDEELVLWKRVLPALVERCRTWEHGPGCEYKSSPGDERPATIPLSVKAEQAFLCSCGNGKLPERYMGGLPEWEGAAAKHAVRVAISPLFAVPWVEDIMDVDLIRSAGGVEGMVAESRDRCRRCGATERVEASGETADSSAGEGVRGKPLMRCTRCRDAMYCSLECQKKDWKKHRMECRLPGQGP